MDPDTRAVVHVCGDTTVDWLSIHGSEEGSAIFRSPLYGPRPDVRLGSQAGGAALMVEFLQHILPSDVADIHRAPLDDELLNNPKQTSLTTAWTAWQAFDRGEERPAFRVAQWRECVGGEGQAPPSGLKGVPQLLVIDDSALGFRNDEDAWPEALKSDSPDDLGRIVLKMVPAGDGKPTKLMERILKLGLGPRTTVLTSLKDLRYCAVNVRRSLSWEQMLEDIVAAVGCEACPFISGVADALAFDQVIVAIEASGAVVVGPDRMSLIFDRTGQERDFSERLRGDMLGYNTCIVGALAASWVQDRHATDWVEATRDGLALARLLHLHGYEPTEAGSPGHLRFPGETLAAGYHGRRATGHSKPPKVAPSEEDLSLAWNLGIFDDGQGKARGAGARGKWTILEERVLPGSPDQCPTPAPRTRDAVWDSARQIVLAGPKAALRDIPIEQTGGWSSADRAEIEGVRSVTNALRTYLDASKPQEQPLSIAVFGPPGSGKSFVVKQIAEGLAAQGRGLGKDSRLTFNLSQLQSPEELVGALHQVRDLQLRGKTPLVFWDEFDCNCGNEPLGWLRYFLAPMQDGEFYDAGRVHPTGGGIYVFAGSTAHSFQDFCDGDSAEDRKAKKPDFISRLKAYINVRGTNGNPNSVDDELYPIRRAFMLNSLLERNAPHLKSSGQFAVDPGVLEAFLKTTRYYHGARSMEALVAMSDLSGKKKFELSCLPPDDLLRMHVDVEDFTQLTRLGYRDMLRIGVAGHIALDPLRVELLQKGIDRAAERVEEQYPGRCLTVFSPLAVGACRLAARVLLKHEGARLIAVLPMPQEDYVNDFGLSDLHTSDYRGAEYRQEFRHLIAGPAVEVIQMSASPTREDAYRKADEFVAEHSDATIVIWDGQPAQGPAGTAYLVEWCLKRCSPIVHVWAGNFKDEPKNRTDVGDKHGKIRWRNFPGDEPGVWLGDCPE